MYSYKEKAQKTRPHPAQAVAQATGEPWGSRPLTHDSHDESMEVTKDLWKNCSSVLLTLNQNNADEHRHAEP